MQIAPNLAPKAKPCPVIASDTNAANAKADKDVIKPFTGFKSKQKPLELDKSQSSAPSVAPGQPAAGAQGAPSPSAAAPEAAAQGAAAPGAAAPGAAAPGTAAPGTVAPGTAAQGTAAAGAPTQSPQVSDKEAGGGSDKGQAPGS
ncbi:hypothetical protein GCK32_007212 [Trichostrongylus colubriformis]|uniref:Uncharacterized protein n=1 Tax=Trichostrongylus colubriformis TaxID=6319 RepID=A0AAN8FNP1_TRICO